jgi:RimJ/RimL family protein N-acetyltransferase
VDLTGIHLTTETLRTERLVLRPFREDDVAAVLAACRDPDIQHWSKDPRAPQPSHARAGALHAGRALGLGAPRVHLVADVRNAASRAVAPAAGFTQEGVLRSYLAYRDGSRGDAALFSRLLTDPPQVQHLAASIRPALPTASRPPGLGGRLTGGQQGQAGVGWRSPAAAEAAIAAAEAASSPGSAGAPRRIRP